MSSSACYTNKIKTTALAKNTKVHYPGNVANNHNTLQATLGCNPNFTVQNYVAPGACGRKRGYFNYLEKCVRQ